MPTFRERLASDLRNLSDDFSRLNGFILVSINAVIVPLSVTLVTVAADKRTLPTLGAAVFFLLASYCTLRGLWVKMRREREDPGSPSVSERLSSALSAVVGFFSFLGLLAVVAGSLYWIGSLATALVSRGAWLPLGVLVAGLLSDAIGPRGAVLIMAGAGLAATIALAASLRERSRRIDP